MEDFVVSKFDCISPSARREAEVNEVAGFLEVGQSEDAQQIMIKVPGLKPDASGAARIRLSQDMHFIRQSYSLNTRRTRDLCRGRGGRSDVEEKAVPHPNCNRNSFE
jgi:hypothetical protein